jgi:hypothetical protein
MKPREPLRGLGQSSLHAYAVEVVNVIHPQAAAERTLGWVEVRKGKELQHDVIAGEDHPSSVAVSL